MLIGHACLLLDLKNRSNATRGELSVEIDDIARNHRDPKALSLLIEASLALTHWRSLNVLVLADAVDDPDRSVDSDLADLLKRNFRNSE